MMVADNQERTEKIVRSSPDGLGDTLAGFIERHRRVIAISALVVVVLVLGFAAGMGIRENLEKRGISRVEALLERYDALRFNITESEQAEEAEALLADSTGEAKKGVGYAGARAWYLVAQVQGDLKNWEAAETAWVQAAKKAGKSYLAPAALFNAGAAAEERGNAGDAIGHYTRASSFADFPQAPRALFSIGRLREGQEDTEAALDAYRTVLEKWPATAWANFANSRIITLTQLDS
jgi:tetratricopeptide (TPR) repeat protein